MTQGVDAQGVPGNAEQLMRELNEQAGAMEAEAINASLPMARRAAAARMAQALRGYIAIVFLVDWCRDAYNVAIQPDEDAPAGTVH